MTWFGAIKLKILALKNYLGSTYKLENKVSFLLFAFPNLDALDFTWAIMFINVACNCANLASMVLDWLRVSLLTNPLLTTFFPF